MEITLTNPLDMHLHLRDNAILEAIAPYSAKHFYAAVVMPNLTPPITSLESAKAYTQRILHASKTSKDGFYPICALYITDELDSSELQKCVDSGIKILKLYPKGATTGSQSGVSKIISDKSLKLFEQAQKLGMILSIHGESNGFMMEREYEFGEIFAFLARTFPNLKIIIEHMSDHRSIPLLREFDNIYATLTLHHITMNLDNVLGGKLEPHHFCKPTLKTPKDQQELLRLALNADPKVSFGSDSAPHTLESKLKGAAGIFSAPCLLEQLAWLFEQHNALENLQAFISDNAMRNYNLTEWIPKQKDKHITLIKRQTIVPKEVHSKDGIIIPLNAGKTLEWSIKDS